MTLLLGAIADDLTGATDLASMLARRGMRTVQAIGVPARVPPAEAVVVALKSRSIPAAEAVALSLAALAALREAGARQILFKYCSTFDSTEAGNIGPVAEALMAALGTDFTIFCPALPENRRTVYQGHLFVGDRLLSESGMEHHPLTPMTDPDLVRVLGRQARGRVGLVPLATVRQGASAIGGAFARLRAEGVALAVADAVEEADLAALGAACAGLPLVTGGSGIALGLPANFRAEGFLRASGGMEGFPRVGRHAAIVSGSCSRATLGQVAAFAASGGAVFALDPLRLASGEDLVAAALDWARPRLGAAPVLVSASAPPEQVRAVQERLGRERAGEMVEAALGKIAAGLHEAGVRRLVVAGGETSGAVIAALGLDLLAIGPAIDPGVPWTASVGDDPVAVALKSGNFGAPDFFTRAFRCLP